MRRLGDVLLLGVVVGGIIAILGFTIAIMWPALGTVSRVGSVTGAVLLAGGLALLFTDEGER